jgi:hypothetical protein
MKYALLLYDFCSFRGWRGRNPRALYSNFFWNSAHRNHEQNNYYVSFAKNNVYPGQNFTELPFPSIGSRSDTVFYTYGFSETTLCNGAIIPETVIVYYFRGKNANLSYTSNTFCNVPCKVKTNWNENGF